jgi:hypothetical protein
MTTYDQVAKKVGLTGNTRSRYLRYMRWRWHEEERSNCLYGYAEEWALRFSRGEEWFASDETGHDILVQLEGISIA